MGRVAESIDARTKEFIAAQEMYFVGTAPLDGAGFVNVSPKGLDTFRVLDEKKVAYLDLTGSGVETIAHVRENGRIVVMFCAFQGAPKILRLHGRGRVVEPGDADFAELRGLFGEFEGVRSVIVVDVCRVAESCGFGVPEMRYEGEREQLQAWARSKGPEGLGKYREEKNRVSVDGLPGVGAQAPHR
jgi:Pyridoxamine 5'-phosphate oxidase